MRVDACYWLTAQLHALDHASRLAEANFETLPNGSEDMRAAGHALRQCAARGHHAWRFAAHLIDRGA